jgi:pyruvate formate lyase activating enzyme
MDGIITDIQRFCVHDGPGIRTTVFFKGCNLRCGWCHNPETTLPQPQLQVYPDRCIACGACLAACPRGAHTLVDGRRRFDRQLCAACGTCARTCYAEALKVAGRQVTAHQLLAEVLEDRPFYAASGGGVTLSGGEPLCQREFCIDVLRLCKDAGLHTAIETNLAWPWERVESVLPWLDLVMADIKTLDAVLHMQWTGVPNKRILDNARRLSGVDLQLIIRTPVIPGVNDNAGQIGGIADFIAGFVNLQYYELLPYHPLGTGKYASLGMTSRMPEDSHLAPEKLKELSAVARQRGIEVRPGEAGV